MLAPRDLAGRLPPGGVYRFRGATGRVLHVGRAVSPPEWAGFAQRSAELPARLVNP